MPNCSGGAALLTKKKSPKVATHNFSPASFGQFTRRPLQPRIAAQPRPDFYARRGLKPSKAVEVKAGDSAAMPLN